MIKGLFKANTLITTRRFRKLSSLKSWDYDVLICGGGIVGSALASSLLHGTQGNIKIAIMELRKPEPLECILNRDEPDKRTYALSPKSIDLLKRIDSWENVKHLTNAYTNMQVWDYSGPGYLNFSAKDLDVSELGRIVEDSVIQASIYKSLEKYPTQVDYIYGATLKSISIEKNKDGVYFIEPAVISYDSTQPVLSHNGSEIPKTLSCRLVVGADGGNSVIRRLRGIPSWGWQYGQMAVVATVKIQENVVSTSVNIISTDSNNTDTTVNNDTATTTSTSTTTAGMNTNISESNSSHPPSSSSSSSSSSYINNTAWQVYLPTGPLAVLPIRNHLSSIVWSMPTLEAMKMIKLTPNEFCMKLNEALHQSYNSSFHLTSILDRHNNNDTVSMNHPSLPFPIESLPYKLATSIFQKSLKVVSKVKKELESVSSTLLNISMFQKPFQTPPTIYDITSDRVMFPLTLQQASYYASDRVVLIGDAAHSIHPQAGQGLNLGLQDVDHLSTVLIQALSSGSDIGLMDTLQKYSKSSYVRNMNMLLTVDMINRLFSLGKNSQELNPISSSSSSSQSFSSSTSTSTTDPSSNMSVNSTTDSIPTSTQESVIPTTLQTEKSLLAAIIHDIRSIGMLSINSMRIVKKYIAKYAMGT